MDLAYDAITQSSYVDRAATPTPTHSTPPATTAIGSSTSSTDATFDPQATPKSAPRQNLQTEFQETFKAFSATPWGAKLGGWWSSTTKQGQSYYEEAVKEAEDLRLDALKGLSDLKETLVTRTRGMSGGEATLPPAEVRDKETQGLHSSTTDAEKQRLQETDSFLSKFKATAAARLKEVQAAEDAADEALLRFGTNIRNFLKDAVVITDPESEFEQQSQTKPGSVLFESKDQSGKRIVHASRLDGQLYVVHTSPASFAHDPEDASGQWTKFRGSFDIEKQTEKITRDLERYPELRQTMEECAEQVEYQDFWTRYYYLRMVLEGQEARRKELLKASANETEHVAWDEDSDEDNDDKPTTPQNAVVEPPSKLLPQNTNDSSTTVNQPSHNNNNSGNNNLLKPTEGRRSHDEKSVADSEASYDIVSGAPSRAASSPTEKKVDESDEEDWE